MLKIKTKQYLYLTVTLLALSACVTDKLILKPTHSYTFSGIDSNDEVREEIKSYLKDYSPKEKTSKDIDEARRLEDYQERYLKAQLIKVLNSEGYYDAKIQYYLEKEFDKVTFEILDRNNRIISTHIGDKPEYQPDPNVPWWRRGGSSKPTTAKGLNNFTWDLRYPGATTFDGMIIWSAQPKRGPKAPPGNYKVKMTAGDYTQTYDFDIHINPNLEDITEADLQEQFTLASKIMNKTSDANQAVISIFQFMKI